MIDRVLKKRIVPVAVIDHADDAVPLAEALLAAGMDIIEITLRTPAAEECIRRIVKAHPEMLVGAGTILTPEQVRKARDAGATFGVSAGLNEAVVKQAVELGMTFIPGVATASEVEQGLSLGCKILKLFPAETIGGPALLKAWAGPYAHTGVKFIPLGGISPINAHTYLQLAIVAAVGGSWMADRKLIAAKDWARVTQLTKDALAVAPPAKA